MTNLIKRIIDMTVGRLYAMISSDTELTDRVLSHAGALVSERISDHTLVRKITTELDTSEIAENLDLQEIAGHIDVYDIVNNIDMSDVAEHIDMNELAELVERRMPEREVSPAPEDPEVSGTDLIERLLEKAVTKLLDRAEEAVKNGEV